MTGSTGPRDVPADAELEALTGELRDFVTAMKAATARPDDR